MNKTKLLRKAAGFIFLQCIVVGILFMMNFNGSKVHASDGKLYDAYTGVAVINGVQVSYGSSSMPYIIDEPQDLIHLAEQVSNGVSYSGKYFQQAADIDIGETLWTPIGNYGLPGYSPMPFSGNYSGSKYKITNLKIGTSTSPNSTLVSSGLFGYVKDGCIEDVHLENTTIYSSVNIALIGGVAGVIQNATVKESSNTGCIVATNASNPQTIGGIIGGTDDESVIEKCSNSSNITAENAFAGGIVGDAGRLGGIASIKECRNTGNISVHQGNSAFVGGIAGALETNATLDNSCNAGNVMVQQGTNNTCVGGIVGIAMSPSLSYSYNTGNVTGSSTCFTGGIAGASMGNVSNNFYNSSSEVSSNSGIGFFVATSGPSNTGAEPKTLIELMSKDTYSGWNFDNLWGFAAADNNNCPVFRYNYSDGAPSTVTTANGIGQVIVSWQPVDNATSYRVYYRQANEAYSLSRKVDVNDGSASTIDVTGLASDTTYYFVVRTFYNNGSSLNSDEVSGVPAAPQTVPTTIGITAGKGLVKIMTGKPQYANGKIPFVIDSQSFSQNPTGYSFDVIYDPTKVGTVTVDSFNGLTKPTIGTPSPAGDSSKEKVTVSWNGTLTGDYISSKGILFKLNFVSKQDFISGEMPIEIGTGSFTFASGSSSITGTPGKIISGIIYGDVNGDGAITSSDTNLINKYVSGKTTAITEELKKLAADVNGDGAITAADAKEISNYISGKASTLKTLFGY